MILTVFTPSQLTVYLQHWSFSDTALLSISHDVSRCFDEYATDYNISNAFVACD